MLLTVVSRQVLATLSTSQTRVKPTNLPKLEDNAYHLRDHQLVQLVDVVDMIPDSTMQQGMPWMSIQPLILPNHHLSKSTMSPSERILGCTPTE